MDHQPHPGFGGLTLTRDDEPADPWDNPATAYDVTFGEIEQIAAADPDHDWRLRIDGPLEGVVYQRHGPATWHPIERLDGFA